MTTRVTSALVLTAAALLSGCAMTPEEKATFRENFMRGLSATQPMPAPYQIPYYQMPIQQQPRIRNTDCIRTFNGGMSCTTY